MKKNMSLEKQIAKISRVEFMFANSIVTLIPIEAKNTGVKII